MKANFIAIEKQRPHAYYMIVSDAPEPRLGSVLAQAFKKKARLGSLNISKSLVSKIHQKRAYYPFLLKNQFEHSGFFTNLS